MQALRDVFDTNHDGKLDAGDWHWSDFKVMVTNPDGTTTLKTPADLGITAISLIPDKNSTTLPDGSRILGQAIFTKADGTTGTAADALLRSDLRGYAIQRSTVVNPDGSTTIDIKALNPDGSLGNETVTTTSADGLTTTIKCDYNGDGVFNHVQTDATVVNADGSRTETLTNKNGAGVLLDGATSADKKAIMIRRRAGRQGRSGHSLAATRSRSTQIAVWRFRTASQTSRKREAVWH